MEVLKTPGNDLLSRQRHYHRPGGLNGRVRNGNGCGPSGMVTGKLLDSVGRFCWLVGAVRSWCARLGGFGRLGCECSPPGGLGAAVVKRLAVSTGQLRRLPAVHLRPINLVVFQGPSSRRGKRDLILGGASRLDAFSAYPFRAWLPCGAAGATTGTPEARPRKSSRTILSSPQVSCARSR